MGKCRSYRPRKRKFHGNQNTSTETASSNEEIITASSLKLQQCNEVNNDCNHHKGSSSSMEPVGAYRIFERSKDHRMLRYTDYYGDGDSKALMPCRTFTGKILLRNTWNLEDKMFEEIPDVEASFTELENSEAENNNNLEPDAIASGSNCQQETPSRQGNFSSVFFMFSL
ncbi:hypothetical protein TNCV_4310391 [Trichonephila clavipes]|nr:hypothetical protein TNCV_4310391 [Trichonephila clavipes]